MSIPKQKLHELIDLLPEDKTGEIINIIEKYIDKPSLAQQDNDWNPDEFLGILDNLNINVDEECRKMREEWDHRGWNAISD
jgi:hypothetical protein